MATRDPICNGASRRERRCALSFAITFRKLLEFRQTALYQIDKLSLSSVPNGPRTRKLFKGLKRAASLLVSAIRNIERNGSEGFPGGDQVHQYEF